MSVAVGPSGRRLRGGPALRGRAGAIRARAAAIPTWALVAAGVAALVGLSAALRSTALHAGFWIDEGIAVGVSDRSITSIPSVLRLDGSPPAYYLLLSLWIHVFGAGQATTHMLSLLWALLSVPVGLWAGWSLFGRRAGWTCAALAAVNPFLTYYAQETRMYAMVATISLALVACFAHAYVLRRRRYLVPFVLLSALEMYTHNWGLFLVMGTFVALGLVWLRSDERRGLVRDALIGYGAISVLYLPWVPTVLFQAKYTGAPWSLPPHLDTVFGPLSAILGGVAVPLGLLLAVGAGVSTILKSPAPRRPGVGLEHPRHVLVWVLVIVPVVTLVLAWTTSQIAPAWALRYFAALVGPMLLLAAVGLSNAGRLGLVALAIVLLLQFNPRTDEIESKSNARRVAAEIAASTYPGDLVVNVQPEQTPVVAYYLRGRGLRYADSISMVGDPGVFDWRDAYDRFLAAKPTPTLASYVSSLRPGQTLVLSLPVIRGSTWRAPWTSLTRKRSAQWVRAADRNPLLEQVRVTPTFKNRRTLPRGLRVVLYRKLAAPDRPAPVR